MVHDSLRHTSERPQDPRRPQGRPKCPSALGAAPKDPPRNQPSLGRMVGVPEASRWLQYGPRGHQETKRGLGAWGGRDGPKTAPESGLEGPKRGTFRTTPALIHALKDGPIRPSRASRKPQQSHTSKNAPRGPNVASRNEAFMVDSRFLGCFPRSRKARVSTASLRGAPTGRLST